MKNEICLNLSKLREKLEFLLFPADLADFRR